MANNFKEKNINEKPNICSEKINKPLSQYYDDAKELYLPHHRAYKFAEEFKQIPPHQMRKVLDQVKGALNNLNQNNFKQAQKKMFMIVPMTAYNCGRLETGKNEKLAYSKYYDFIQNHISDKTIRGPEDIEMFDELYTSVIAYHKEITKRKGK